MKKSVEVDSVVRRFLEARVAMDMEAMRSLHSGSKHLRLIATDDVWLQGPSAVLPAGGSIGDPDDWTMKDSKILRIEAFEEGAVGWAAAEQERTLASGFTFVLRFDLRIGVHTGDLLPNEGDVVGLTVNKAARIAATAAGGQILVSETTNDIVGSQQFDFDLPIRAELKGLDGVHRLHPLQW